MSFKKFSVLVLISAFCGCGDGRKPAEAEKPVIKKNTKDAQKGNVATVTEPA
jgi:hypothetical protein